MFKPIVAVILLVALAAHAEKSGYHRYVLDEDDESSAPKTLYVPAKPHKSEHARVAYIRDCTSYGFDSHRCAGMWDGKTKTEPLREIIVYHHAKPVEDPVVPDVQPTIDTHPAGEPLLDVDNVEYKARRAAALNKPNAVVEHFTLQ